MDLKLKLNSHNFADLVFANNDFLKEDGLETSILISLFTDRRVSADELPDNQTDQRGWWGDVFPDVPRDLTGSRLWLLERQKHTSEVRELAREYILEALAWLIEDGVASAVNVNVDEINLEESKFSIEVIRPKGRDVNFKYSYVWSSTNVSN